MSGGGGGGGGGIRSIGHLACLNCSGDWKKYGIEKHSVGEKGENGYMPK